MSTTNTQLPKSSLSTLPHSRRPSQDQLPLPSDAHVENKSSTPSPHSQPSSSSSDEMKQLLSMMQSVIHRIDRVEAQQHAVSTRSLPQAGLSAQHAAMTNAGASTSAPPPSPSSTPAHPSAFASTSMPASVNTNAPAAAAAAAKPARSQTVLGGVRDANKATLGLGANDMQLLSELLSHSANSDDDNADEHKVTSASYLPSLYPMRVNETAPLADAIKSALIARSRSSRRFPSFDKLLDAFQEQFVACVTADSGMYGEQSRAWRAYERYIIRLFLQHGLDYAQDYHFALFERISNGTHSLLAHGYFNAELMHELSATNASAASRKAAKAKARRTVTGAQAFRVGIDTPCSVHGSQSRHTTEQCQGRGSKAAAASGAKAAASPSTGGK